MSHPFSIQFGMSDMSTLSTLSTLSGSRVIMLQKNEIPIFLSKFVQQVQEQSLSDSLTMAVSGGSLPILLGRDLITDYKWNVFLADERLVKLESEDSNYKLIGQHLLSKWKNSIGFPINYDLLNDPDQIAKDYEMKLDGILGANPFDIIFLGMGPDGHTCSLFPGHELLNETKKIGIIRDSPKPPLERITLTFPVLNTAKNIVFVVTGKEKAQVLSEILIENSIQYPAGSIKNPNIIWVIDTEAGSKLK